MMKTNSLSPSFSTFTTKRKKSKNRPFADHNTSSEPLSLQVNRIPRHVQYIPNKTLNITTDTNNNIPIILINPFNNPPSNCSESDSRWIWRKQLEKNCRHIRNTKYYNNYVGNKSNISTPIGHSNRHHLKHAAKIGCPSHSLSPILSACGYNISATICTHRSYLCCTKNLNDNNRILLGEISMNDIGLKFNRNAFSTFPLHISYNNFSTNIYIKRIANTNFNKTFRPGSYGKIHSTKKGSWKEGKIFYVFENDELVMNICNGLYIVFNMKSNKLNEIIDGFKNIVGGVGLYRPPQSTNIVSCLVFRKNQNVPMQCLENSMIKIYKLNGVKIDSKLIIGDKIFDFSNELYENEIYNNSMTLFNEYELDYNTCVSSCCDSLNTDYNIHINHSNDLYMEMKRNEYEEKCCSLEYENNLLITKNGKFQILNNQLMESNSNLRTDKERQYKMDVEQIKKLQYYLEEQQKQIHKLNEQVNGYGQVNYNNNNQIVQSPMSVSMDTSSMDQYSITHSLNNNLEEEYYFQNYNY